MAGHRPFGKMFAQSSTGAGLAARGRFEAVAGTRPASPIRANVKDTMARKTQPVSKLVWGTRCPKIIGMKKPPTAASVSIRPVAVPMYRKLVIVGARRHCRRRIADVTRRSHPAHDVAVVRTEQVL